MLQLDNVYIPNYIATVGIVGIEKDLEYLVAYVAIAMSENHQKIQASESFQTLPLESTLVFQIFSISTESAVAI